MRSKTDVDELFKLIIKDEKLNILQKKILLNEVRKLRPPEEDRWVFRTIVWVLGAVALGAVLYPFVSSSPEIPAGLLSIGSAAMGALAGYLTPSIRSKNDSKSEPKQAPVDEEMPAFDLPQPETQQENSPRARV
ncbi:hypothetical protein [Candidatus Thiothrix anitrata]|uniref:Uncharacterized protein n=1 Tax=Candidatus Thiothrix anitrata TaxID=2823902 RepID=A0ABX7X8R1_9GAMM|nr:hypothetical protein [Candidatus Thiothrix anitrata]QTR51631.1 hypothetical protein J8380_08860 [Candidatus Thiothrix anitrata]